MSDDPFAKYASPPPSAGAGAAPPHNADDPFAKYASPASPAVPHGTETAPAAGPSFLSRVGTGMADPLYGMAQIGARMGEATDMGFGPELAPGTTKQVDETTRKREETYQSERKAGGQDGIDWARMGGNVISPATAPLMLIPGGAAIKAATGLGRVAAGALGGAVGGAAGGVMQPATGVNFGVEKAEQAGLGAAGGAVIGGAGGALAKAIIAKTPEEAEKFIQTNYARYIKPSVAGKNTFTQLDRHNEQVLGGITSIVRNKAALKFGEGADEVTGEVPKTLEQFADAIGQTKTAIFQKYSPMAEQAGEQGLQVDLAPTAAAIRERVSGEAMVLHPEIVQYANDLAQSLESQGAFTPLGAQRAIQNLNVKLKSFYKNPTAGDALRTNIEETLADSLRKQLDQTIEQASGPGYQALKNEYGALASIEKEVVHRAVVDARKNAGGGLMGLGANLVASEEVIRGVLTGNMKAIATGIGVKGVSELRRFLTEPNRAVRRIFETAEKMEAKTPTVSRPSVPPVKGSTQPSPPGETWPTLEEARASLMSDARTVLSRFEKVRQFYEGEKSVPPTGAPPPE